MNDFFSNQAFRYFAFISLIILLTACREDASLRSVAINNKSVRSFLLEPHLGDCRFVKLGNAENLSELLPEQVNSIFFRDNKYWVFNRIPGDTESISIRVFNARGQLETVLPLPSEGPSNFKGLVDFWTDGKNLELLDLYDQSIWRATYPEVKFSRYPIGYSFYKFFKIDEGIYIFDSDNSPSELTGEHNLALFRPKQNELIDQGIPIPPFMKEIGLQDKRFSHDPKTNSVFYIPPVGTTIYRIGRDSIEVDMELKFLRGSFQEEDRKMTVGQFLSLRRSQKYITTLDKFISWGNLGFAQYRFDRNFYWALFDRKTGGSVCIKPDFPFANEYLLSYQPIMINKEGEVAFFIHPSDIFTYYEYNPEVRGRHMNLDRLLSGLSEEDNPVVMWVPISVFENLLKD